MVAYLVHTGVIADGRIGWMRVMGNDGTGYHPNTGVRTSHTPLSFRMRPNKVRMTLFNPLMFHIGASGDDGVGLIVHTGEVTEDKTVGKAKSEYDVARFGIQFGC